MKNITNKTLGIIGIILLVLSFITSATDSDGNLIFPALGLIRDIAYMIFVIVSASRLWKSFKYLVLGFISFNVLYLVAGVMALTMDSSTIIILNNITILPLLILNIYIIVKLFKKEGVVVNKEPEPNPDIEITKSSFVYSEKEGLWEKTKNFLLTGIGALFMLALVLGWVLNLVKFFKLDFREPFKAEVIRGIGLAPTPIGSILGYISIKDK